MKKRTLAIINNAVDIENSVEEIEKVEEEKKIIPDKEFMSRYVWITNKQGDRQLLVLNDIQEIIEQTILDLQEKGIPPRIVILKARQEGVSTSTQGKMISNVTQKSDRVAFIVAHEENSVKSIFKKSKFMYEHLPEDKKPLRRASNAKELIFDIPLNYKGDGTGLNSYIGVQIAGKEDIGRGNTIHYCHLSEFAFWKGRDSNSPEAQLSAILQAVPKVVDSFVIIESTAKGFNCFKDVWDKAVAGENGFTPLFFAWHDMKEYQIQFKDQAEKEIFIATMDEYEKEIQQKFNLLHEQLNWYRTTKKVNCNNNSDKMKQENPSFPEEAFIFTGTPVFNNETVMNRINYLKKLYKEKPYITGKFQYNYVYGLIQDDEIKFNVSYKKDNIEIRIYEKVRKGYPYSIGADTKGEGKDKYTATVVNCITQKVVAVLKADLSNSKPFTEQLYCLGRYYNNALIGVEMNFNTAPLEKLKELQYPRQYKREKADDITRQKTEKIGWKTDGITRPRMIDYHVLFTEEHISCFSDIETLQEMLTFVKDENGRPDAMSGKHDDLLFSHMIANEIQSQQPRIIDNDREFLDIEFTKLSQKCNIEDSKLWEEF